MSSSSSAGATGESQTGDTVGVQELIDRLKTEGVREGREQAEALLVEAKGQAAAILDAARAEGDAILKAAQQEAERTHTNGSRALALASRDSSLQLKEQLQHEFRGWVAGLVRTQLEQQDFLAEMIREICGQALSMLDGRSGSPDVDQGESLRFLVADDETSSLESFVKGQVSEMLRAGVSLQADRSVTHGFRVQIVEKNIEIDFSDEAVTAVLMRFLAPKFRQLIGSASEGE
jgi:V/A-type H+-transporting ATPase subunit E